MPENILSIVQNTDDGHTERLYSVINNMAFNVAPAVAWSNIAAILSLGWYLDQLDTGGFQYVDIVYGLSCTPLLKSVVKNSIKITLRCRAETIFSHALTWFVLRQLMSFELIKIERLRLPTLLAIDECGPDIINFGHSFLLAPDEVTN